MSEETAVVPATEEGKTILDIVPEAAPAIPETKTDEGKPEGEGQTAEADAKPVVPEKYEFTVPEGLTLDPAEVDAFTPLAKELGLTQEAAQKLVDFMGPRVAAMARSVQEADSARINGWYDATTADPEIGGKNLPATVEAAKKALVRFASPEDIAELKASGLVNFRPFVKMLAAIGKASAEGTHISGATSPAPKDPARTMYPSMPN